MDLHVFQTEATTMTGVGSRRPSAQDRSVYDEGRRSKAVSARSKSGRPNTRPIFSDDDKEIEEDLETVLDTTEERFAWDPTGERAYIGACKKYGIVPSSTFHNKLKNSGHAGSCDINLMHYGLGPKGALCISIPLVINDRITSLNLKGNDLGSDGVMQISRMMEENTSITELNLAENNLKGYGARIVGQMLRICQHLKSIDISGNSFSDTDAAPIARAIEDHTGLTDVVLSNNNFGSKAGVIFRKMIAENGNLDSIDLSWNELRGDGALSICLGVKDNVGLKSLNLAWNGFGNDGAIAMGAALDSNRTLQELDLTCNRIMDEGFVRLCKSLATNDTLVTLKLGRNVVPETAATAVLELLLQTSEIKIELLDLAEMTYTQEFNQKILDVQEVHTNFICIHGYTDSYGKRKLKSYDVVNEALSFFQQYMTENNINLVDLFAQIDQDGSMSVSYDEFKDGLKAAKIPMTASQIEELIKVLDQDGDGEIDFSELVIGAEEHKG